MQPMLPLEFDDFSGGQTDNYIGGLLNQYELGLNLLVTAEKQLKQRPGSQLIDASNVNNTRPSSNRIGRVILHEGTLWYIAAGSLLKRTGAGLGSGAFASVLGPTSLPLFPNAVASVFAQFSHGYWNGFRLIANDALDRPIKVYYDSSGAIQGRTAGLPRLTGTPTVSLNSGSSPTATVPNRWMYRLHYSWGCTLDSSNPTTFKVFGPVFEVAIPTVSDFNPTSGGGGGQTINVVHNSPLSNALHGDNYETSGTGRVKVSIYRTVMNGTTFFKLGERYHDDNTPYVDSTTDAALLTKEQLYTNGGVLDFDQPPRCKFAHVALNRAYYAYTRDEDSAGGGYNKSTVVQSIDGNIDAAPGSNNIQLEEEVTGISSVLGRPVVMCLNKVYRLDGEYDSLGQGVVTRTQIADKAGCVSHQSIVQTQDGIFWAGNDGFYFSDAYQVTKISNHLNQTYAKFVSTPANAKRIQGAYDPTNRRILWTVQTNSSSPDCDTIWALDLRWGITPQSCFTPIQGDLTFTASSIEFYNQQMIRGGHFGYVYQHIDTLSTDLVTNTSAAPNTWKTTPVIYDYVGPATNFGSNAVRHWVPLAVIQAKNETNLSLQPLSINDDGRQTLPMAPIRYRGNVTWGDSEVVWGDASLVWNGGGMIERKVRFPGRALRCSYKQMELTNAHCFITNSDTLGTVTVTPNPGAHTGTASLNVANSAWPVDPIGQNLLLQDQNYQYSYPIISRSDNTITYQDLGNTSTAGVKKWEIQGIPKNEIFHLISYTLHYAPVGALQQSFQVSDGGANQ